MGYALLESIDGKKFHRQKKSAQFSAFFEMKIIKITCRIFYEIYQHGRRYPAFFVFQYKKDGIQNIRRSPYQRYVLSGF